MKTRLLLLATALIATSCSSGGQETKPAPRDPLAPYGQATDNVQLGPGSYTTFEFKEDNPGTWLVHCHVPAHMEGGMMADYIVSP